MVLIFCASYLSIPSTIDVISREKDDFRILSADFNVIKFFSELYSSEKIIRLPLLFGHFKNPRQLCLDLLKLATYKKRYFKLLKKLQPDKIVFFFVGFNGIASWLIKKMSLNTGIYYRAGVNTSFYDDVFDIKLYIKAVLLRFLFDTSLKAVRYGDSSLLITNKRFLSKVKANVYPEIADSGFLNDVISQRYPELPDYKVLLLLGKDPNVEEKEYERKILAVLNIVLECFRPDQIAVKQHPNPNFSISDHVIPKDCVILPDYIPANLLCYKCSILISRASGTLFEAVNVGKIAISLLYFIKSTNSRSVEYQKKYLSLNSKRAILFPNNLDELRKIFYQISASTITS